MDRPDDTSVWTVVVAAGSGSRFGGPKQHADLGDRSVLERSVAAARSVSDGVVVVVAAPDSGVVPSDGAGLGADRVVVGGASRSRSVANGLDAVPGSADVILVHDAARPLASEALFRRVVDAVLAGADAVVPAVAVVDTIRSVDGVPIDRDRLRAVQTPQGFRAGALRDAHAGAGEASDDAGLVEATGGAVVLVEGERTNLKITEPVDLVIAEALLDRVDDEGADHGAGHGDRHRPGAGRSFDREGWDGGDSSS